MSVDAESMKPAFPVSRVKKIMKTDPKVKMVSQEAAYLITKATEMFIGELAKEASIQTQQNKRKTLAYDDIASTVADEEKYNCVTDVVPKTRKPPAKKGAPAASAKKKKAAAPAKKAAVEESEDESDMEDESEE